MKKCLVIFASMLVLFSVNVMANDTDKDNSPKDLFIENQLIKKVIYQKKIAWAMAPIKTKRALKRLARRDSLLDLLTPSSKKRFIKSIVFRKDGLGGFDYRDLEEELTPTQIYKILSLFGVQHTIRYMKKARIETQTDVLLLSNPIPALKRNNSLISSPPVTIMQPIGGFADHIGYHCESRATCAQDNSKVCMSRC